MLCPLCRKDIKMSVETGAPMHISHDMVHQYAIDLKILREGAEFKYNRNISVFELKEMRDIVEQWCVANGPHKCIANGTFHTKGVLCGNACDIGCQCPSPTP